jgi:iron(III) transport system substrate-binding protein
VVVYTALDQIYSEPLLADFERRTGIKARAVYDTEAAKTTGLISRIRAERAHPRCDVLWNNEIVQTIQLKNEGLLEAYRSPGAAAIPDAYKDREGCWTGFAARARVLVYNPRFVTAETVPHRIEDLMDARWAGRVGMAYPFFGTTLTHAAVLYDRLGEAAGRALFERLRAGGIKLLDGNSAVCRAVADGELWIGLSDTDDANLERVQGKGVEFVPLEQGGDGALLIPNTVALVKGAPHADAARELIDFLLSPEVERKLAASDSAQIPLHPGVAAPAKVAELARWKFMKVDYARVATRLEAVSADLKKLFDRQ